MSPGSKDTNGHPDKQAPVPLAGLTGRGHRVAIVAARFNDHVVELLIEGARQALGQCGVRAEDIRLVRVPGAFELPLAASALARGGCCDAIVALGCVVRGETPHFEHVGRAAADGLERVCLDHGVPVGFGVLTTNTIDQALARAGGDRGNSGFSAALAAVEMISLLRNIDGL